jgi:hypothetical protein
MRSTETGNPNRANISLFVRPLPKLILSSFVAAIAVSDLGIRE